ncbi:GNAT family N-acetyltransferase [Cumulibacter manganitolerans]|uniref:GNAT family N-acetyltransferase n=1 Tax=Cumulibacter manganitolerans TaxID=1884992 RepID=UPI0012950D67|nr:GNAT family N-acetyltransferase [Cumulibacter manganitolerans]
MSKCSVILRDASVEDAEAVGAMAMLALGTDGRPTSGSKLMIDHSGQCRPDVAAVLASPEFRTLLAVDPASDEIVGFAVTSEDLFGSLIGRPTIHVHYLVVPDERRHRGVGRELLAEVTRFAEEISAEQVTVDVSSEARDVNRYFAKSGFVPLAQRRIATVATLRRTLGLSQPIAAREAARRRIINRF